MLFFVFCFLFSFGLHPVLLLAQRSRITLGGLGGTYKVAGIKPTSAVCEANALSVTLALHSRFGEPKYS